MTNKTLSGEHNKADDLRIINSMYTRWQYSIFQNTCVSTVSKYLRTFFEPIYDEKDIENVVNQILSKNPSAKKEDVEKYVKQSEFAMAIWDYLIKDWNISVNDQEIDAFLDDYYKATNNSIRELKNDAEKRNKIKNDIELRKVIDAISDHFSVKLSLNLTKKL
jgi:hypothetical protein